MNIIRTIYRKTRKTRFSKVIAEETSDIDTIVNLEDVKKNV